MKRILFLLSALCGPAIAGEPVIGGLGSGGLPPAVAGLVLVEEMNCVACHAAAGTLAARSRKAPRLAEIGARVHPEFMEAFLRDPRGTKPGTTMPDVLAHLPVEEKARTAEALMHFLLSQKPASFAPEAPDPVAAREGQRLFHVRGCAACHAPREERAMELPMAGSVPLGALHGKYSRRSLTDFLRQPHVVRPSGRMPDMQLPDREAERIAHFLTQQTRVPGGLRYTWYRGQVWEGLESENVNAERGGQVADFDPAQLGKLPQHTAVDYAGWLHVTTPGTHTFFLTMNGGTLLVDGKALVQQPPSDRRGVMDFKASVELSAGAHAIRLTYFHTGYEVSFPWNSKHRGVRAGRCRARCCRWKKNPSRRSSRWWWMRRWPRAGGSTLPCCVARIATMMRMYRA